MRKKIIVVGPALSQTGYGEQCRFALRALLAHEDLFDIYLKDLPWGKSSSLSPLDEERRWIDSLIKKTAVHLHSGGNFDVSLQVTIPNEWQKIAPINIGYTAGIETTRVTPEWLLKSQLMNRIITISNHSKNVYGETSYIGINKETDEKSKLTCEAPIDVVHYPVRFYDPQEIDLSLDFDFNFLTMAQWGPRKNLDNTIKWWVEEFLDDEVGLVVKTNLVKTSLIDRVHTQEKLRQILSNYPQRKCKVYLIHGNMTPGELTSLFRHPQVKCLVSLTHGEGFGLPLFEAAYNGLPVMAPAWSGHVDFLSAPKKIRKKNKKAVTKMAPHFIKVDYELNPVPRQVLWKDVIHEEASWCYAKEESYKKQLRKTYTDHSRLKKQALNLKSHLLDTYTTNSQYNAFVESIKKECDFKMAENIDELFDSLLQSGS